MLGECAVSLAMCARETAQLEEVMVPWARAAESVHEGVDNKVADELRWNAEAERKATPRAAAAKETGREQAEANATADILEAEVQAPADSPEADAQTNPAEGCAVEQEICDAGALDDRDADIAEYVSRDPVASVARTTGQQDEPDGLARLRARMNNDE